EVIDVWGTNSDVPSDDSVDSPSRHATEHIQEIGATAFTETGRTWVAWSEAVARTTTRTPYGGVGNDSAIGESLGRRLAWQPCVEKSTTERLAPVSAISSLKAPAAA